MSSDPSLIARTRTNDKASRGLGGTLPTFGPSMRASVGVSSFPAIERLERMKKRPGLLGRSWNPSSEQFVQSKRGGVDGIKEEEEERIETAPPRSMPVRTTVMLMPSPMIGPWRGT